jgi:excisionase family DNA binding protein
MRPARPDAAPRTSCTEQPNTEQTEDLLSPEDVARRCGLSRRAVYDAIRRGELPAARLCSRVRISPADLDGWLASSRVRPTPRHDAKKTPDTPAVWPHGSFRARLRTTREDHHRA